MIERYTSKYKSHLENMANAMHQESVRFCEMSFDTDKIIAIASTQYCGLYILDGEPVGYMLGAKHPNFFGHDIVATELMLYIKPENRGGLGAFRLVQDFEKWCIDNNCREINVGSSVQVATETTKKLYTSLGFIERCFVAHNEL